MLQSLKREYIVTSETDMDGTPLFICRKCGGIGVVGFVYGAEHRIHLIESVSCASCGKTVGDRMLGQEILRRIGLVACFHCANTGDA